MQSTSSDCRRELWALVDCNNFYASCERLFRPDLQDMPVVVLSNNDGCIIARSREAKAIGVPMGEPWFKIRDLLERHQTAVFSANFALYGEISNRVMTILEKLCPTCEQYSIDEAFLRLHGALKANAADFCYTLRKQVRAWTGITISVGVGPTPTLAKLANHIAKKRDDGIYSLARPEAQVDRWLERTEVEEIWGIGKGQSRRLRRHGISNAKQLKNADNEFIRGLLSITGLCTALELRGIVCQSAWENCDWKRKTILHSRSFGNRVHGYEELAEAVSTFTARCAERLRLMRLVCGGVQVRIRTSRFDESCYSASGCAGLAAPCDNTATLIAAAKKILKKIYMGGHPWAKAGVMFYELAQKDSRQIGLLEKDSNRSARLMQTIDEINQRYGRLAMRFGAMGLNAADWHMRQNMRSPAYMTSWDELPVARLA